MLYGQETDMTNVLIVIQLIHGREMRLELRLVFYVTLPFLTQFLLVLFPLQKSSVTDLSDGKTDD